MEQRNYKNKYVTELKTRFGYFLSQFSISNFQFLKKGNRVHASFSALRAFTLLELLIYMVILSGLMVVVANSFISLSKGRGQSEARSEVHAAVRFATERMRQDIKNASVVTTPAFGVASSTLKMTVGGSTITYDAPAGQLRRNDGVTTVGVTAASVYVTSLNFTRQENYNTVLQATTTAVQIAITVKYNASSTDWTYSDSLKTTVSLR